MGRRYIIGFEGVAVSAAQDLFEIKGHANVAWRLLELHVTQSTEVGDAQDEMIPFTFKRASGSYTSGSGGSAPTPRKLVAGDAAAVLTAEVNNTTQAAAGSGALDTLFAQSENVRVGLHHTPVPEACLVFAPSTGLVVSVPAPADSITMSGYAVVEEIG